ncbi:Putative inner membrane protein [Rhizobiales bacterium GAS191]|nr:Putative inner membrane protein [Rhizobiales bacterium GAS191]
MKSPSRSSIASSFTLIKGSMIDETYAALAAWDFLRSKRDNLDHLRQENYIGASTTTWLRDVAKVLNRRFDPQARDRALVLLAKNGCPMEEWKPILLWHMTRDEFLLRDFLINWLFPTFVSGAYRVRTEDLHDHLLSVGRRGGTTEHAWSKPTLNRVATGLLKMAVDFGLLRGTVVKQFASYHLPERSFLYLLHAIRDEMQNPRKVVEAPAWRMYLMRPDDVEQDLCRTAVKGETAE